ncbi:MAG TPA: CoA transferase [Candidatus Saccharimonadales bacterium]|nr:CoA transferase [Candidatus Saccharimonadales bacterium]
MTERETSGELRGPLHGLVVLDAATLLAGPLIATILGDYGAEVIKVEHPKGDPLRGHGYAKDGVGLWWKVVGRNKKSITLNLKVPEAAEIFKRLVEKADVLIENFRPGTLEGWGLGWNVLREVNPGLVMTRVTGFGQTGPYAQRAGFGTLAEAMSGFAHITGESDGPPTLPPFGLADGVAAMAGTWATMFALYERDVHHGPGQFIDLAIYEPLLTILGAQPTVYDQLGVIQTRIGNRSVNNAPRNTYQTRDRRWVAVSTSSDNIAERVMRLVGHPEVISEDWFRSGRGRAAHADLLDGMVADWISQRDYAEVMSVFEESGAAIAPIYDTEQLLDDPQVKARGSITEVFDPELGPVKMQNVMAHLSQTPGQIRWTGPALGSDTSEVLGKLGVDQERIRQLREKGAI